MPPEQRGDRFRRVPLIGKGSVDMHSQLEIVLLTNHLDSGSVTLSWILKARFQRLSLSLFQAGSIIRWAPFIQREPGGFQIDEADQPQSNCRAGATVNVFHYFLSQIKRNICNMRRLGLRLEANICHCCSHRLLNSSIQEPIQTDRSQL